MDVGKNISFIYKNWGSDVFFSLKTILPILAPNDGLIDSFSFLGIWSDTNI